MKNITAYSIFLLLFIFSCVKEADITTESEPEVIVQEGETRLITGMVKDTSGTVLPQTSVKIILGELELETEADENGAWNLSIPNSLTEGFVVANKVAYSKSIQRFNVTEDNRVEDIYLARTTSNTELDLGFNQSNLKTVTGRIIDENDHPLPDVILFLFHLLDSPETEYIFNSFVRTGEDGSFEIIYEDNGFISSTLYTSFSSACSERLFFTLEGQDDVEDLGDVVLSFESFSIFQTRLESDGSSCYEDVKVLAYNYKSGTGFLPVTWDQPLGDISLEYCPSETGVFYIGVEGEDNTHFNGLFLTEDEVEASYTFDICTPNPGNFLELTINGNMSLYEEGVTFAGANAVTYQAPDTSLVFLVRNWSIFTPLGASRPAYQNGDLGVLTIHDATGTELYRLDEDSPINYVNIVQDDDTFYSGIVQAKLVANDGSTADMSIRFRVHK